MTCIDTNVLSALLREEPGAERLAEVLWRSRQQGELLIHVGVYAELLAAPGQTRAGVDHFLSETGVRVDWHTPPDVWLQASAGYEAYSLRRQRSGGGLPRRLLLDFVIGAHAASLGAALLTLDPQHYRLAFPGLALPDLTSDT